MWSNGDTTQQISVSQAGSYFVNVSNPSGCTGSVVSSNSVAITSTTSAPVVSNISASGSTAFCAGGSVVLSGNNGGVWSNGATTFSITANQAGTYFVTKSNACGSDTSNSISVTVNPSVFTSTIISASNTNVCSGTPVTFTATAVNGGTSPTYVWKKNGVIITGATNSTYTASGITNGNTFTCAVTSNETCASPVTSTSNTITITVGSGSSASISTPNGTTFCAGQSITLTATSGSAYLWSNGATSQSISPNSTGNYSVTVTNPGGCNGSATSNAIAVTQGTAPAALTISASGNTTFCAGSSVTLSGNSGGTWSNNATSATISVNTTGTYYVTNTNICGSATSNSILVTVNSLPAVSVSSTANTICAGTSVTLTGIGASSYV